MKKYSPLFFFLLLIVIPTSLHSQKFEGVIAEIGKIKITESEFRLRYELSPFVSHRSKWNQDTIKYDFLLSMIAERLWYLEAINRGFQNSEDFKFYIKPLEDALLRDYLFKEEIENKIKLSAEDVNVTINNAQYKLKTRIINSEDSTKIFKIYSLLKENISLDSILRIPEFLFIPAGEFEVSLGSLKDEKVENYLFTLNPNEFTKPIRSEVGWVIFYITDKFLTPIDLTDQKKIDDLKRITKTRRVMHKMNQYLKGLLSNKTIDINDEAFIKIFEVIYNLILERTKSNPDTIRASYVLSDNDYREIKKTLGSNILQEELFVVNSNKVTVWDFLANLAFEEHRFQSKDRNKIYSLLSKIVKDFVIHQYLTFEAKKKGIDKNKKLKDEIENWKIHYLAQMLRFTFLDSARISEQEVIDYFNNEFRKDKNNILLKMKILNLQELEEVEQVLREISSGKSFDEIVESYGKTDSLVNEKGETDLLPHFSFGELGMIASKLNLNEVYGPIKREDKYTLIIVKEKKEISDTTQIDFDSTKDYIKNYLFIKKFNSIWQIRLSSLQIDML
ncbi:MAG: peptidylprolyl isomerase [Ignavibacteria bacterium]